MQSIHVRIGILCMFVRKVDNSGYLVGWRKRRSHYDDEKHLFSHFL
jgi:hypothetical protein